MYEIAFITGLLGSLHCVGMCGPIMWLMLPNQKNLINWLFYHLGRTFTYSFLGLLTGLLGSVFVFSGLQQYLSIFSGLFMIIIGLMHFVKSSFFQLPGFNSFINKFLVKFIQKKNLFSTTLVGLLNGFLPCGIVYAAFGGALATASVYKSVVYMFVFGLGTMPLLLLIAIFKNKLKQYLTFSFNKVLPYYFLVLGVFILLRGLNLGIPYLSPLPPEKVKVTEKVEFHCNPD